MGIPFFLPREEDTETLLLPLGEAWKELYLPLGENREDPSISPLGGR